MSFTEILLIGIALSMDAFAVCLSSGMVYPGQSRKKKMLLPAAFGIFHVPAGGIPRRNLSTRDRRILFRQLFCKLHKQVFGACGIGYSRGYRNKYDT